MFTVGEIESHLVGLSHGGTLKRVRNPYEMYERAASSFLLRVSPIESMRVAGLTSTVYDDIYNYSLPDDFGSLIDLRPQDERQLWDKSFRNGAGQFDREKAIRQKTLSIEGSEGSKVLRLNWRSRSGKILDTLTSITDNGTWTTVNANNLVEDTIVKKGGGASLRFDILPAGSGIRNTTLSPVDLSLEENIADGFQELYFPSATNISSVEFFWGNDSSNYYTTLVTTQADGTAFRAGWNTVKYSWDSATVSGTPNAAAINYAFLRIYTSGASIANIRADAIIFTIGRAFEADYYSKFLFKDSITGIWVSKPSRAEDYVILDNDTLPIYLMECLKYMAHQVEGSDSTFDIAFAEKELQSLYPAYQGLYPNQQVKQRTSYSSGPRWRNRK